MPNKEHKEIALSEIFNMLRSVVTEYSGKMLRKSELPSNVSDDFDPSDLLKKIEEIHELAADPTAENDETLILFLKMTLDIHIGVSYCRMVAPIN